MRLVWLRPFWFFTEESLFCNLKLYTRFEWHGSYNSLRPILSTFNDPALNQMLSINWINSYEEVPNHPSVQMCLRMSEVVWPGKNGALFKPPFFFNLPFSFFFLVVETTSLQQCIIFTQNVIQVLLQWLSFHCPGSVQSCFSHGWVFCLVTRFCLVLQNLQAQ